jgi:predicted AAA+ superfamily ATPase
MKRFATEKLKSWLAKERRKPLVIRGARQVGKSTLVKLLAEEAGLALWEVNLERQKIPTEVFASNDPEFILQDISIRLRNPDVIQKKGILFLDEIQAVPEALEALRYFYEEMPELPVIAAGSLLEFTLANSAFSMPVGRVEFFWLGPMSFMEYLLARKEEMLFEYIKQYKLAQTFSASAHDQLCRLFREYMKIGGMPEAVKTFTEERDASAVNDVHASILNTYREDFSKYGKRVNIQKIQRVFDQLPFQLGQKVRFNRFHPDWPAKDIRHCLELLNYAGIARFVTHSSAHKLPVQAEEKPDVYKLFHLDVGLTTYLAGMDWLDLETFLSGRFINEGSQAEQFTAQNLLTTLPNNRLPKLHYWQREGKSTNAEVDFLLPIQGKLIPLEVKSGTSGSLRSLHQYMLQKPGEIAVRLDMNLPGMQRVQTQVMTAKGKREVDYTLLNLPVYLTEELERIIELTLPGPG